MLAQISLTLFIYLGLLLVKKRALATGTVDVKKVALHSQYWPDSVIKVNNNLNNQFESPVLFYVLCLMLWGLNAVDISVMASACVYVVSRFAHTLVHTTSNIVKYRLPIFTLGVVAITGLTALALLALWAVS